MSILHEIHNQRPAVRHTFFILAAFLAVSAVAFLTVSSIQKDIYFALHQDPQEQQEFLARRDAGRLHPLAAISRVAGSLMASMGALIGWDTDAGFDRTGQPDNTQDAVHLLPLSK